VSVVGSVLIEPGFFSNQAVQTAIVTGGIVALVSGMVGVFTVIRGQSFAGHALSDMGTLGGSGAFLAGVNPLWGFVGAAVVVSGAMEVLGVERRRGRDVATGIVLGAALGISALLLYFDTTRSSTTGVTVNILFGSLFTVSGATIPFMIGLGAIGAVVVAVLYRPLLVSSVSTEMAAAGGVPVRVVALAFLLLMGVSVALSSVAVGTILSTALLIGPAATALRITKRPGTAMLAAGGIGVGATWLGILLAYDSFYWPPAQHGWPVSFLVVAVIFTVYLLADFGTWIQGQRAGRRQQSLARPAAAATAAAPAPAAGPTGAR
jgi:zinc/manganese transport system permease protein